MIELGRPLSEAELSSYDVLPLPLAKRVRVLSVPRLPGGYDGMTLGRFVILARQIDDTGNSSLLAHELVHVRQWADLGLLNFSSSYVLSFLGGLRTHRRWGPAYRSVDAEVEARLEATDWLRRHTLRRRHTPGQGADGEPSDGSCGHGEI